MRSILLVFFLVFGLFIQGEAGELVKEELRVEIDSHLLTFTDRGMILSSGFMGDIFLETLHHDENGYYTTFKLEYECSSCQKHFVQNPDFCDECLSGQFLYVPSMNSEANSDLALQLLFLSALNEVPNLNGAAIYCRASLSGRAQKNEDGSAEFGLGIDAETEDGAFEIEVDGTYKVDPNGNGSGSAEGKFTWNFLR